MKRDVFYAIADPTRRAILNLLALQAMTPNSIALHFASSRQAISKHIKLLSECGLIIAKHEGRKTYYDLNPEKIQEMENWLTEFRATLNKRFNQLENLLKNLKNKSHD